MTHSNRTLFTNARLIDPEAATETLGSLIIENGMIVAVYDDAAMADDNAAVIDCAGKYLAPALSISVLKCVNRGNVTKRAFALQAKPPQLAALPQW